MTEWRNGRMAEWRNGGNGGRMAKWSNGGNGYLPTIFMVHANDDDGDDDDDTDTFKSFIVLIMSSGGYFSILEKNPNFREMKPTCGLPITKFAYTLP